MLGANVWRRVLGVDRATVIEEIDLDEESETVMVHVRLRRATKRRASFPRQRSGSSATSPATERPRSKRAPRRSSASRRPSRTVASSCPRWHPRSGASRHER